MSVEELTVALKRRDSDARLPTPHAKDSCGSFASGGSSDAFPALTSHALDIQLQSTCFPMRWTSICNPFAGKCVRNPFAIQFASNGLDVHLQSNVLDSMPVDGATIGLEEALHRRERITHERSSGAAVIEGNFYQCSD